jgi:uncharacterized protein YecT (DUF1311 family)
LNLCKANNSGAFVALMYLNGEGTPRDLNKAEAALKVWRQKNPDQFSNSQAAALKKAINGCRGAGTEACPRLDYCKDFAEATLDLEICDAAAQVSAEAALSRTVARIRNTLSANDRAAFDRVVANFKAYQVRENGRGYDEFGDGTIRGLAGTGQAEFVRDNFLKLMAETTESRELKPIGLTTYRGLNAQLDRVYKRSIRRIVQSWQEDLRNPTFKDQWDEEKSYIKEYEESARESQAQWIKFRDSCADLATSLYRDQAGRFDPAVSMKAAVTKLRIAELRYNPIGPKSN